MLVGALSRPLAGAGGPPVLLNEPVTDIRGPRTIEVATTLTFDPASNEVHIRYIQASNGKVLYDKKLKQA